MGWAHNKQRVNEVELRVEGMHCSGCAFAVRRAIEQEGGEALLVDFSSGRVKFRAPEHTLGRILSAIRRAGYTPHISSSNKEKKVNREVLFVVVCALLTLPQVLAMAFPGSVLGERWLQFVLALPVYVVGLLTLGRSALGSLIVMKPNMNVLIMLGASASFFYSLAVMLASQQEEHVYFETASSIITLILLGNWIEKRTVARTRSSLEELAKMQKGVARVEASDGTIRQVQFEEVRVGDVLLVGQGERIATDGVVVAGEVLVDESIITGESVPVLRREGDSVIGGSVVRVVRRGPVRIRALATGEGTVLASIIRLVEEAQRHRARLHRLADRVSAWFVPAVVAVALLTFIGWRVVGGDELVSAMMKAVAVLVIACPCALGLATPTAIAVGVGMAARRGVLVRRVDVLEHLSEVDTVILDKTGTLTTGRFRIHGWGVKDSTVDEHTFRRLVVSVEEYSLHPVARSICKEWADAGRVPLTDVKESAGSGIEGVTMDGQRVRVEAGVHAGSEHDLVVSIDGRQVGWIDIADQLKEGAKELVEWLKAQGMHVVLLTGDRRARAERTALQLGIEDVRWEQRPEDKVRVVKELEEKGHRTCMIGDGINDAPALEAATASISFSDATSVAQQSAGIVILGARLHRIRETWKIARYTFTVVKQNLFWAFFYNVLAIPVASAGFLSPAIAAGSMILSDVIVVGNSLRLRYLLSD